MVSRDTGEPAAVSCVAIFSAPLSAACSLSTWAESILFSGRPLGLSWFDVDLQRIKGVMMTLLDPKTKGSHRTGRDHRGLARASNPREPRSEVGRFRLGRQ